MKSFLIALIVFVTLSVGGMSYNATQTGRANTDTGIKRVVGKVYLKGLKVPYVSENPNIPQFIDTFMKGEKERIFSRKGSKYVQDLVDAGFAAKTKDLLPTNIINDIRSLYKIYDHFYPKKQFINFKCTKELMSRYNLKMGALSAYIGEVPEDRLKYILSFKSLFGMTRLNGLHDLSGGIDENLHQSEGYGNLSMLHRWGGTIQKEQRLKDIGCDMTAEFFIMAPQSYFAQDQKNTSGTFGFSSVKDPIVISPVEGGYIIVTAW